MARGGRSPPAPDGGRIVGREIPAREALADAPGETAFTEIEVEEKPTWVFSASQVVAAPHLLIAETTHPTQESAGATGAESVGETRAAAGEDTGADLPALPGVLEPEALACPRGHDDASQVVAAAHSPIAYASLDELPTVLSAPDWRALEGRLEWSAGRKAFILREADAFLPEAASCEIPELDETTSPLRPGTLSEVVGQKRAVENLSIAVKAAGQRGEPLAHVLLTGQPGLGKTTLAGALAREMGGRLHAAMGALLTEPAQVFGLLTRLERNDILFVDEIHRLPAPVTECLHSAMEDRVVHVLLAERGKVRALRVELAPFTLAGATMEPGELPEAFRARFPIRERLDPYAEEDLARLAGRVASRLKLEASEGACAAVARRARGTPREALRLLARARDVAQTAGSPAIEASHVEEAAERLGIDADGLQAEERYILTALIACGCPMGLEALAATLGMDPATLRHIHEPYLCQGLHRPDRTGA